MKTKATYRLMTLAVTAALLLAACGQPAPATPAPVEPTSPPAVEATTAPAPEATAEGPCLVVGALYGGPITDAGYNQAMHESVMAIKDNIACVDIIEAENVPDEAGATSTMENMIEQGA